MSAPALTRLLLLTAVLIANFAMAAPPSLATRIATIERAQAHELARIEAAIAEAGDQAAVIVWQRCAAHVKLATRLALHQAQLDHTADPQVRERLTTLAEGLQAQLDQQRPDLPDDYAFDPLATPEAEVTPCAE